jgi:hypothetical protein
MDTPSLDGRWFRTSDEPPDTQPGTTPVEPLDRTVVIRYSEQDGDVWGVYVGGRIRRGYLVGRRDGDRIDCRYVELDESGDTASGHCESTLRVLDDGRLRMDERWDLESRQGSGTRVLEEMPDA